MAENEKKVVQVSGWESLKQWPSLQLLACVMDPEEEHERSDILAAIAEKFELANDDRAYYETYLQNNLVGFFHRKGWVRNERKVIFDIPIMGSVRLVKNWYVDQYHKDDVIYEIGYHYTALLEVNSRVVDSRVYDEQKMMSLEGEIRTLFEKYDNASSCLDYYDMIEQVFKKGSTDSDIFFRACQDISRELYGVTDMDSDYAETMVKAGRFIFDKYMFYLWGQEEDNKPLTYRLGLDNFIFQNLPHWLNGRDGFEMYCNLYTDEHKEIVKMFKAQEPDAQYLYKLPDFLNLKVWKTWTKSS